ncbi:hypothetical protein E1193_01775 [Micromonospora sp. KC606]|uniref:hypothetical protein n=1 Tax=Micromonospora sp. KC606 TaxID=2530379 RepID=UPI00104868BB|nr:hypothetical protein [Micromonospora sp. KC606]TDC85800.1 hypothetical protein E1193_01775 [Micromonospora sp. KC606]
MVPVLLFESAWKPIWLALVAVPQGGAMDAATREVAVSCSLAVLILAVIPWRFAFTRYVTRRGDRRR